jgi:hypothetical protein
MHALLDRKEVDWQITSTSGNERKECEIPTFLKDKMKTNFMKLHMAGKKIFGSSSNSIPFLRPNFVSGLECQDIKAYCGSASSPL